MIEDFLHFIHKEDTWIEIRLIGNGVSIPKFYHNIEALLYDLKNLRKKNEEGFNIYYGILSRKEKPEKGGGKKEHVSDFADKLWLDIDVFSARKPEEYANLSNEEIKNAVLQKYREFKGVLESYGINISACVYSGRGFQPIIRLGREVSKEEIEAYNKILIKFLRSKGFKADNAWDCARVLRFPGFYNMKDKNRPLLAELIEFSPENTTEVSAIFRLISDSEEEEKKENHKHNTRKPSDFENDLGIKLEAIRKVDKKLDELLSVIEHPDYPSPSEADMACVARLYFWRFDESQIVDILRTYRYREKLERDDYIELTLSKIGGERFNPAKNPSLFLKLVENSQRGEIKHDVHVHVTQFNECREDIQETHSCVRDVQDVHVFSNSKGNFQLSNNKISNNPDNLDSYNLSNSFTEQPDFNPDILPDIPVEYFFEKDKFVAKRLADVIMQLTRFVALEDTEEIWYYKDGIYHPNGETLIKKLCQKFLREEANKNRVSEVIAHIQRSTYAKREIFDKNPDLIAVENGVINLQTMEFLPHSPDHHLIVKIPVKYDPNADCPNIKKFFSEVLHPEDIPVIEELIGYCLYRKYFIHKAFMFIGSGRNGKSTLLRLFEKFLGESNISHVPLQAFESNRFATAELQGKLANIYADLSPQALRDTGVFKTLTGEDTIIAERKFKSSFQFKNYAKLIFSCNKLPEVYDESDAFFARWIIIDFPNKFEGDKADKNLLEKLTTPEELSGLLNLALDGLKRLLERGEFSYSVSTEKMREQYIKMSDPVNAFVTDMIEIDPNDYVPKRELYLAFCQFCRENKLPMVSENVFHRKLIRYVTVEDYRPKVAGSRIRAWKGIRLKGTENEKPTHEEVRFLEYDLSSMAGG